MEAKDLMTIKYDFAQITKKRSAIRKSIIARSPNINGGDIERICKNDLALLFQLYDNIFLHDYFKKHFPGKIKFSLSTKMTRSAGKVTFSHNLRQLKAEQQEFEIRIGISLIFNFNELQRNKKVNGLETRDALEALQLVFEHEIIHLLELHHFRASSCCKESFITLAHNIFGHTDRFHNLPTEKEIARISYGFKIGECVCFNHGGETYEGLIYCINKRATVMVPDKGGPYQDRQGKKYSKWYIPIKELVKQKGEAEG